jgi:E3 ubiquitin-protein ligase HUWE1
LEENFKVLLKHPRLIEFENKCSYFRSRISKGSDDHHHGSLRINVRRDCVFEDSFHQLRHRTADEMHGRLNVQFQGEDGVDAGGVTREWYQVMARAIFKEELALFTSGGNGVTFQPNPNSMIQNEGVDHLQYFKFVGRFVAKALLDNQILDAYFTRSLYKHLLGEALSYEDIEAVDPDYFKNLKWMLENDINGVFELNFTAETDYFGKKETVELKPGGTKIPVTNDNKTEYVNLIAKHRMTNAIEAQVKAFLEGFWDLVAKDLLEIFNDKEVELLISGLPEIDIFDMKKHTEYNGYFSNSPVIKWFWEVVQDLSKEDKARLIQFCTGTSKVPLQGFKALIGVSGPQKFNIQKAYGPTSNLPTGHSCFNQLDLVEYESKEQLKEKLLLAIREASEGFGFA